MLLAAFDPSDIFPFMLGGIVLLTPIIAILTHHQRKMAEIIHGNKNQPATNDAHLAQEIARLRDVVSQQTVALDSLAKNQKALEERLVASEELRLRLNG